MPDWEQLSIDAVPPSTNPNPLPFAYADEQAHARRTDPETSHEAAASVNVTAGQQVVLDALTQHGPCTDEELVGYMHLAANPAWRLSPSGIRSRRHELTAKGKVGWTGEHR
jgi:hypothetical protein